MPVSSSGGVGGSESSDAYVKAVGTASSHLRGAVDKARRDPSTEIGISAEELQQRRKLATSPRTFLSEQTNRVFDVKSSARAQQIMHKGLLNRQREKRQKDMVSKMGLLRRVQVGLCVGGFGLLSWIGAEFLLPHYAAVQERNRILQIRYEMAHRKRELES